MRSVRGLDNHLKTLPWKTEIEFCVVMGLKCSVKTQVAGLSAECYFLTFGPFYTSSFNYSRIVMRFLTL